jgi:hypothetical protein
MRLTMLVVLMACLMGALLALTLSPHGDPDAGPEMVSEQPAVVEE